MRCIGFYLQRFHETRLLYHKQLPVNLDNVMMELINAMIVNNETDAELRRYS